MRGVTHQVVVSATDSLSSRQGVSVLPTGCWTVGNTKYPMETHPQQTKRHFHTPAYTECLNAGTPQITWIQLHKQ